MKKLKILLVRDDRLGDIMLTAHAVQQLHNTLKANNIDATTDLLATLYTQPAVPLLRFINTVHTHEPKSYADFFVVRRALSAERYDAAISFFSSTKSALLLATAGIPYRLAPKTKLAQVLHNRLLRQNRSQSHKPEHAYNCDLVTQFAQDFALSEHKQLFVHLPAISFTSNMPSAFDVSAPYVMIHPANGQSARNVDLVDYAVIAEYILAHNTHVTVVLLAGPHEQSVADALHTMLQIRGHCLDVMHRVVRYDSLDGIMAFAAHVSRACLFVSASTGTAHVAALFDVPTLVFFADIQTAGALRWQTLNSTNKHIGVSAVRGSEHLLIDAQQVACQAVKLLQDLSTKEGAA